MPVDLEQQLPRFAEALDRDAPTISVDEIIGRATVAFDGDLPSQPSRWSRRSPWLLFGAAAGLVAVLVAGLIAVTNRGEPAPPAATVPEPTPTPVPTTTAPTTAPVPTTVPVAPATVLETIEAGVAAFYSGDADRAAELFELPDRPDDLIRQESAYHAAINGRPDLDCTERTPGTFGCYLHYRNALTDAARAVGAYPSGFGMLRGYDPGSEGVEVVVEDGVITAFEFPEYTFVNVAFASFLAKEGRLEGYEDCIVGPFTEACAVIQLDNLDDWTELVQAWDQYTPASHARDMEMIDSALGAWYGGDCLGAHYLAGAMFYVDGVMFDNGVRDGADALCPPSASTSQTIEYESILEADVTVQGCETGGQTDAYGRVARYSCDVQYANAMNTAVGKSPSVTVREFVLLSRIGLVVSDWEWPGTGRGVAEPWYLAGAYPEDTELRESFKQFAESGELRQEYAAANCATERTPDCAHLIIDNLDDWATWHHTNR